MRGLALLLLVGWCGATWATEAEDHRRTLANLKAQLVDHRAALKDLHNEERSILLTIRSLDRALAQFEAEGRAAALTVEKLRAEREVLTAEVATKTEELNRAKSALQKRWRGVYVEGQGGAVRHLLGAQSFEDYAYRYRFLTARARVDRALLLEVERTRQVVAEKEQKLRDAEENAEALRGALSEQGKIVTLVRQERTAAISTIEGQKELSMRAVTENVALQKEVQQELLSVLRKAPKTRRKARGVLKAGLRRPVKGVIFRDFGTIREKGTGAKITSNGIHIKAKLGTPVASPGDGTVAYTGWMRGFGQIVIVDLGEKTHALLAHLSRSAVQRGDLVARGQTVGFVGDTESTDGAKLYFELRRQSRPINPVRYLKSR